MAAVNRDGIPKVYERIVAIETTIGYMREDMQEMKSDVKEIKDRPQTRFVTEEEVDAKIEKEVALLRKIVYGAAGMVLVAFIGTLIARSFVQ